MAKKPLPQKWQKEQKAIRAIQMAFDVNADLQYQLKRQALDRGINPSDRLRELLGLPVTPKPVRPRLSLSLSQEDLRLLAKRYNVPQEDTAGIKRRASAQIAEELKNKQKS